MEGRSQGLRVDEDITYLQLSHQPRSLLRLSMRVRVGGGGEMAQQMPPPL